MKKPMSEQAATQWLEELCARSEQCRYDLAQKLYKKGVSQETAATILNHLEEQGFVNELRFACAFVRDKYRFDRWGRKKIVSSLMLKRISRDSIDKALKEIDIKQYGLNCYNLLQSKRRQLNKITDPYDVKQRLLRFAAGRGYEPGLIIKLLDNPKLWDGEE
ncbi:MAG: recombination regulator RecX [Firmicutes bacterium]|nr:recombination regulator RecX [Bacillota bacterium]MCM1400784.1 recombination regulator RecX [Bacteroides sp.]MCM1476715.1 recombination regulator RecX [Bacteroides sp.]